MEIFLEILKYTVPSIVTLALVYFIIDRFLKNEDRRRNYELRASVANMITPIKLSAYERLILFLERTAPESLILRVQRPEMNNLQLQIALLNTIRQEYEHNFSQQIYISSQAAEVVKNAKESLVQLINLSASKVSPDASSQQLSIVIIETFSAVEESPTKIAVDFLRNEVRSYFG
jgi:hypothetical protein